MLQAIASLSHGITSRQWQKLAQLLFFSAYVCPASKHHCAECIKYQLIQHHCVIHTPSFVALDINCRHCLSDPLMALVESTKANQIAQG